MGVIYPPRPKGAIPPRELDYYEKTGLWLAQYKYNGSRSVIHIEPSGVVSIWSRHGEAHKSYVMPREMERQILALPGLEKGLEYWLDGELLLNKTTAQDTKNKLILFDVLHAGRYLFMVSQPDRLARLDEICGRPRELDPWRGMAYCISEDVLMAPHFYDNFAARFREDHGQEVEGLLLRKKKSVLDNFGKKEYEIDWMVRCRRPNKNVNF